MSFLNKFQYHYHSKQIETFVNTKNYDGLFTHLQSISDKKKIFYDLSLKYSSEAINQSNNEVTRNKIVWINSFLKEDIYYISSFFKFYLKKAY